LNLCPLVGCGDWRRNATPVAFLCNFASQLVQFSALPLSLEHSRCNSQILMLFILTGVSLTARMAAHWGCAKLFCVLWDLRAILGELNSPLRLRG
jgi:hypothetical protein